MTLLKDKFPKSLTGAVDSQVKKPEISKGTEPTFCITRIFVYLLQKEGSKLLLTDGVVIFWKGIQMDNVESDS